MPILFTFLLRIVLVTAGLAFAASLAVALATMLAVWGLRTGWARLTGRPVTPFIVRIDPRSGFERMYRPGCRRGPARAHSVRPRSELDVTDVQAKPRL